MRIGLVGSAEGDVALLREAVDYLFDDQAVERVIYLETDGTAQRLAQEWSTQIMGDENCDRGFLRRALAIAPHGSPREILELLERDRYANRIRNLYDLPEPPARAIEMCEEKVVVLVHNKALLDAEDIANAFLVVYGSSRRFALNQFGPRTFFSPGAFTGELVFVLERQADGNLALLHVNPRSGAVVAKNVLEGRQSRVVVLS